jgi:hypothetical protein
MFECILIESYKSKLRELRTSSISTNLKNACNILLEKQWDVELGSTNKDFSIYVIVIDDKPCTQFFKSVRIVKSYINICNNEQKINYILTESKDYKEVKIFKTCFTYYNTIMTNSDVRKLLSEYLSCLTFSEFSQIQNILLSDVSNL